MQKEVITTYLEMVSPASLCPKVLARDDVVVKQVKIPTPAINHFFFVNVGRPWMWYSRLPWTFKDWQSWVAREEVTTWVGYVHDSPFGYVELERQGPHVEIAFFGLLPQFIGQGLGGFLLSEAIRLAWSFAPSRVWVHTCTLDHKHALKNYLDRGFTIYKEETDIEEIPEADDPVWFTPDYYRSLAREYDNLAH
jgi:GNAT superfamily N-acetyltransferase